MEISAKVLREVEFSGSLRGYNTDEVDEFLEKVALAVDQLQSDARLAVERAESDRARRERAGVEDEESLRRTLVLAQRTADLAIKEAQEESARLVDEARAEAEAVVGGARESAERLAAEADHQLSEEVGRLTTVRDRLTSEIATLTGLLDAERERLTESLSTALRLVERTLTPGADILSFPTAVAGSVESSARDFTGEGCTRADGDSETGRPKADASAGEADERRQPAAEAPDDVSLVEDEEAAAAVIPDRDDLESDPDGTATSLPRAVPGQYDWESVSRPRAGTG